MKYQTPMTIMNTTNGPMTSTRNDFHTDRRGGVGGSTNVLMPSSSTGAGRTTSTCVMSAPRGGHGRRDQ